MKPSALVLLPSALTLSCASLFPSAASSASDLHALRSIQTAQHHVRRFAAVLEFPHPVEIRVIPEREMPTVVRGGVTFEAAAYTLRTSADTSVPGCTLTFTAASVRSLNSIAHEVCHCALDYTVLETTGYRPGTALQEIYRREAAAGTCAAWLTDLSASTDRERRAGQWPREFADYKPIVEE